MQTNPRDDSQHDSMNARHSHGDDLPGDDIPEPLNGPHDYETRVQSYLQSLKTYIEGASVRKPWTPRTDLDGE